jgi:drug/metabolite transporter (DMT)-like permease
LRVRLLPNSPTSRAWIALVITAVLWAGQSIAAKAVVTYVTPGTLSFLRWGITLAVVLPFAFAEVRRERKSIQANWRILLLLGLMSTSLQNTVFYWGIYYSTATNAALLNSTIPIWILILSSLFFGRRSSHGEWAGVFVSLAGVLCIVLGGSRSATGGYAINPGDLIMAAGLVNWSLYSVLVPRRPTHLSGWTFVTIVSAIGVVAILPVYGVELALGWDFEWNTQVIVGTLYMALVGSIITTITYNYAIDKLGSAKASFGTHLVPVCGMLLAFLFLGETPTWVALGGFALVMTGIFVGQTARR